MGKTLLGIGYILMAIPYVNFIGIILVAIGWYTLGKDRDKGLWKVTGILGIVAFILALAAIAVAASMIFAVMAHGPEAVAHALATGVGALIAVVIAAIFLVIFSILQLVCLWQFGNEYNSSLTKVAVIIYIIAIVVGAASIPLMISAGPGAMLGLIGVGVLSFIAGILAGIGILTAKEQAPTTTTTTTTETPPPPPQ